MRTLLIFLPFLFWNDGANAMLRGQHKQQQASSSQQQQPQQQRQQQGASHPAKFDPLHATIQHHRSSSTSSSTSGSGNGNAKGRISRKLTPSYNSSYSYNAAGTAYSNMDSITPLKVSCETGCVQDWDCASSLVCFQRSEAYQEAPGCTAESTSDASTASYCVSEILLLEPPPTDAPTKSPTPRPTPSPTEKPTPTPTASPTRTPTKRPTPSPTVSPSAAPTSSIFGARDTLTPEIVAIQSRLIPYTLDGGQEFVSASTYQSKAVERMAQIVGMATLESDAKLVQYYVLYCIYEATYGQPNIIIETDPRFAALSEIPGWVRSSGWDTAEEDVAVLDPCDGTWHGIACDSNGRVTDIVLYENLLTGVFPSEVVLLASDGLYATGAGNLNRLDLFKNMFLTNMDGDTYWWWQHLGSNFESLLFQQTSFGGDLAKLPPNLVEFDCSYSLITGGLDDSVFEERDHLSFVVLDGNFFNASVPQVLGQLPELEFLYIADSAITGDLSYLKQGMPKLYEHWIDFNPELKGTIPTELGAITTLGSLSLTENGLYGTIPTELGGLRQMRQIWLSGNALEGDIPTQLGRLRSMHTLQLEGNPLTGSMPSEICANYDGSVFQPLDIVGADCSSNGGTVECSCCTCCSFDDCVV